MADNHARCTYNDIHKMIARAAERIQAEFKPDVIIAIGGGGFFPARVMRTFLKDPTTKRNIPIQAIGLSLYESLPDTTEEQLGQTVIRTQWLGPSKGLLGRRALIVDEVDDSRTTLHYAVTELQNDIEKELETLPENEREAARTKFAIFVVHNKLKPKAKDLPPHIPYYTGAEVGDVWLDYPWEMKDIDEHDRLAALKNSAS
ncbi:PRTase-like protein [Serendipita vermifera]|nr:PRTase-like protein [Serendipita vermifera]